MPWRLEQADEFRQEVEQYTWPKVRKRWITTYDDVLGRTGSGPSMKPLRVLSIIHPFRPAFSGEAEAWLKMIPALRQQGVDVEILTSAESDTPEVWTALIEGVVVHRVVARPAARWGRMRAVIAALIKEANPVSQPRHIGRPTKQTAI